jgi:hypothetical protein
MSSTNPLMREICQKCKQSFHRKALCEIRLNPMSCYLCPQCLESWTKIYNKWKKTGYDDFWNRGWNEFQRIRTKKLFNPSLRGST